MKTMDDSIAAAVADLECLRFFPQSDNAHAAIMKLLKRMVNNEAELEALVTAMIDKCGEWEGTAHLRSRFCSLGFVPKDGVYADGEEPFRPRLM